MTFVIKRQGALVNPQGFHSHHWFKGHDKDTVDNDLQFKIGVQDNTVGFEVVVIEEGFETDGYSIPFGTGWFVKGLSVYPAILHDYLCKKADKLESSSYRRYADHVFRDHLLQSGVSITKTRILFTAVRVYGYLKFKIKY